MKHLKKFNEELLPSTYRNAARKLKQLNKTSRAISMSNYIDSKEFGSYNIVFANTNMIINKPFTIFTDPEIIGIYYGYDKSSAINNINIGYCDYDANDVVKEWKNGSTELCIIIEFGFRSIESKSDIHSHLLKPCTRENKYVNKVPTFSLKVSLFSNNGISLDDYNNPEEWDYDEGPPEIYDIYKYYREYNNCDIELIRPNDSNFFGIFSDRKSALSFKRTLPSLIEKSKVIENLMELLSIVNADAEDIEITISKIKNIKINALYDDRKVSKENINKEWYNGIDISPK